MDLLTLTPVLLYRKLCSKLDRLSDRNKRGGFYGGLVNQTDTRGKEREIEFRDSADEFVGTVRAARVALNAASFIPRRRPQIILIKEPEKYMR